MVRFLINYVCKVVANIQLISSKITNDTVRNAHTYTSHTYVAKFCVSLHNMHNIT